MSDTVDTPQEWPCPECGFAGPAVHSFNCSRHPTPNPPPKPEDPNKFKGVKLKKGERMPDDQYEHTYGRPRPKGPPIPDQKIEMPEGMVKHSDALRIVAKRMTGLALTTLAQIAEHGQNEGARVHAAKEILTRGWGVPHVHSEAVDKHPASEITVVFGERPAIKVEQKANGKVIDAESGDASGA